MQLRAISLLGLQRNLRERIMAAAEPETALTVALRMGSFSRPRAADSAVGDRLMEAERTNQRTHATAKQTKRNNFLADVLSHAHAFREFHRRTRMNLVRLSRAVQFHVSPPRACAAAPLC